VTERRAAASSRQDPAAATARENNRSELDHMVIATSYPFLGIFWSMLVFFAWVIYIWIAIVVLIDVFRRHDTSGWAKAGWVIFIIVVPFLGVLVYLIVNHQGMAERRAKETQVAQDQFDEYVRKTASTGGAANEIEKAKQLLDNGTITQAEFDAIKAKALT
jgi:phospholipase D-like protein/putative oligomerization/nucleic acid binding protein